MGDDGAATAPQARRRQQLARITTVATTLFQEHGYETTSVNDVAAALEMSVGGLYRYISTKSDLLVLVCEDIYGALPTELEEIAASTMRAPEKLGALLDAFFDSCDRNRDLILLMYREYRHLPATSQDRFKDREASIVSLLAGVIDQGVAVGAFRDVDSWLLALDIVAMGHLPALKGWALRRRDLEPSLRHSQKHLVLGLIETRGRGRRSRSSHA